MRMRQRDIPGCLAGDEMFLLHKLLSLQFTLQLALPTLYLLKLDMVT